MQTELKKSFGIAAIVLVLVLVGTPFYYHYIVNPNVIVELEVDPESELALKVMSLTLPDGKKIPVNYLRDGAVVYVGADGRWWRNFSSVEENGGDNVELRIQGSTFKGRAVAITDNMEYRDEVFTRLRPNAPTWLPEWMKGVLVKITLAEAR